jgi:hypothetical protein
MSEMVYGDGTCAMPGCGRDIPVGQLMCRPHWQQVPYIHRQLVFTAIKRWKRNALNLGELRHVQEAAIAAAAA